MAAFCAAAAVLKQVAKASRPRLKRHWSWGDGKGFLWDSEHRTNAPNCIMYPKHTPSIQASRSSSRFWLVSENSFSLTLESRGWYIALRNINRYIIHKWLQQLRHSCHENRYKHADSEDSFPTSLINCNQEAPNKRIVIVDDISFWNSRKCESCSRHCQQKSPSFLSSFCLAVLFKVLRLVSFWCDITAWCELWYY